MLRIQEMDEFLLPLLPYLRQPEITRCFGNEQAIYFTANVKEERCQSGKQRGKFECMQYRM